MSMKKAVGFLKKHKKFLITAHANIDGDALGAELALYRMLKKTGKEALVVNEDELPYGYDFLPQLKVIKKFSKGLKGMEFDCLVVLDCSDLKRLGQLAALNRQDKPILNIDHHISNAGFGQVNWVEPQAACTCEMLYRLFKKMKLDLDAQTALCLYAGILTDTGSFRYSNTTGLTHRIVARLLSYGIDVAAVYKQVYGNIPFADLRLLTAILPTMKREAAGKLAWFEIRKAVFKKQKKIAFDLSESLLNFGRTVKDVEAVVLFKENIGFKNEVRVNFRSQGMLDVNRIAGFFGGGGHKTASGVTIKGTLVQVKKKVLKKVREALGR
jgi:phosphoesterase RecJ-like protein